MEVLDTIKTPKRGYKKALRVPVINKIDKRLQVMGMVQQGVIKKGEMVQIMPQGIMTKVHGLQIDDGTVTERGYGNGRGLGSGKYEVDIVESGENVIISFDKGDKVLMSKWRDVGGGAVICSMDNVANVVQEFVANVYVNEIPDKLILTKGFKAMFHCHNLCVLCEIIGIKRTKTIITPILREHDNAVIKIRLEKECVLETYNECRVLGRFILRDKNKTVMIGKIEKVFPLKNGGGGGIKNSKKNKDNDEQKSDEN